MKFLARLAPLTLFAPMLAFAQSATYFVNFINQLLAFVNAAIPFVFALAFLVFIWGMFKAFILGGSDPEKQSEGKQLMLYAIVGFVIMVALWGVVNLVIGVFGFDSSATVDIPDLPN
jgi:Type IV secretion system pilin